MSCYWKRNSNVKNVGVLGACADSLKGEFVSCCAAGDICLSNGICQYTHSFHRGGTGYYTSGCTDPSFEDSSCPQACVDQEQTDITYNFSNTQWQCCGVKNRIRQCCNGPLGKTFSAPPPGSLSSIALIVGTSTRSSIVKPTLPTVTRPIGPNLETADPAAVPSELSGISKSAAAGIGVGYVILVCAVVALSTTVFVFKRRLKCAIERLPETDNASRLRQPGKHSHLTIQEMPHFQMRRELEGN